jgi:hypothetical protein
MAGDDDPDAADELCTQNLIELAPIRRGADKISKDQHSNKQASPRERKSGH